MFASKIRVEYDNAGTVTPAPIKWLDNFDMRNFTNDQILRHNKRQAAGLAFTPKTAPRFTLPFQS